MILSLIPLTLIFIVAISTSLNSAEASYSLASSIQTEIGSISSDFPSSANSLVLRQKRFIIPALLLAGFGTYALHRSVKSRQKRKQKRMEMAWRRQRQQRRRQRQRMEQRRRMMEEQEDSGEDDASDEEEAEGNDAVMEANVNPNDQQVDQIPSGQMNSQTMSSRQQTASQPNPAAQSAAAAGGGQPPHQNIVHNMANRARQMGSNAVNTVQQLHQNYVMP